MIEEANSPETGKSPPDPAKKKRKKRKVILFSLAGFILVFFAVSVEITSRSKFCSVCHYMKPFYQSWKSSSHGKIECNVCHYPPGLRSKLRAKMEGLLQLGRYWSKLYLKSKPWAEIPDESCLRPGCHDRRLLEGPVGFKKVAFDHKVHFSDLKRGKQLRCTSCHSQIVQGEHITVTESSCFICHFKPSEHYPQIGDCSHCHKKESLVGQASARFNHASVYDSGFRCDKCHSQVVLGDGAVPRENCYKCHFEKSRLDRFEETDLMHRMHMTSHKIECQQCHLEIQHKVIKDIETISDCRTCHTGSHGAQKILYTGEGGKGVSHPMPNIMLEKGLSCKGCHIFHEEKGRLLKSDTATSKAEACESCHGKGFARIQKNWALATARKLEEVKAVYERAAREVRESGSGKKKEAQALLEEATFNIDLVERGKSVHNINYSRELLSVSWAKIEEALRLAGSAFKPPKQALSGPQSAGICSNCHSGIEEINTKVFGLEFPHKSHIMEQKLECSTCHSNARKHGEFVATRTTCAGCHHQEAKRDCGSCHPLQKTLHEGGSLEGLAVPKDIMAEAEVGCEGCHVDGNKKVFRPGPDKCVECHDEKYRKTLQEWQDTTKSLLQSLPASLKQAGQTASTQDRKSEVQRLETLLEKIRLDGSFGVHNYLFIEEFLTNLLKTIKSKPENGRK